MARPSRLPVVLVLAGLAFVGLMVAGLALSLRGGGRRAQGGPKIAVHELEGVIGEQGGIDGAREAEQLHDFAMNDDVRAVLVRIDSPGGAVAPSQELHEEILRTRKRKKVVCSLGNTAASGGYYIAVACDRIIANPGTVTGSIGVISRFFAAPELLELAKVQQTTLKTGALKDSGSPFRSFDEKDRAYFEALQQRIYGQFLEAVAAGRGKTVEEIRPLADGRVFTGEEAKGLGLVDGLGNLRTAVEALMELADLHGEPELVRPEREGFHLADLLRNDVRSTARAAAHEAVRGAVEGLGGPASARSGVMLLAPGFGL
jgi:protease-4